MEQIAALIPPSTGYYITGVLVFIVLDVLTGLTKAFSTNTLASSKMRAGLWHKTSILLMVSTALAIDVCLACGLNIAGSYVFEGVVLFVILSEIVSIVENIAAANPDLNLGRIRELFGLPAQTDKEEKKEK